MGFRAEVEVELEAEETVLSDNERAGAVGYRHS